MCEGGDKYIMVEWVQLTWVQIWKMNGTKCVGNDASVAIVCCIEGMQGLELFYLLPEGLFSHFVAKAALLGCLGVCHGNHQNNKLSYK